MRECDEIRVFAGRAERTGNRAAFRSTKNYPACSSLRDLARKYRIYGDGIFYLESSRWPAGEAAVTVHQDLPESFQAVYHDTEEERRRTRRARFLHQAP